MNIFCLILLAVWAFSSLCVVSLCLFLCLPAPIFSPGAAFSMFTSTVGPPKPILIGVSTACLCPTSARTPLGHGKCVLQADVFVTNREHPLVKCAN